MSQEHSHYHKSVKHLDSIDVYRVLSLFNVTDPCIQHAVKKLLVTGGRGGAKSFDKDVQDAIDSLKRLQDMRKEDEEKTAVPADVLLSSGWSIVGNHQVRESKYRLFVARDVWYEVSETASYRSVEYSVTEHNMLHSGVVMSCGRFVFDAGGTLRLSLGVWDDAITERLSVMAKAAAAYSVMPAYLRVCEMGMP